MDAFSLGKALESAFQEKALAQAFETIKQAYFAEYEDADPGFVGVLREVYDTVAPYGVDGKDFDEFWWPEAEEK